MNSTERLVVAVQHMWDNSPTLCGSLGAIQLVVDGECESSPEVIAVREHVKHMRIQTREVCDSYDKLRSLVGAVELAEGVEAPSFYVAETPGPYYKHYCPVQGLIL